jgi:hypothetical protein
MSDESIKRAAQEYLAAKLAEEGQSYEQKLNTAAALALSPAVWKRVADTLFTKCRDWNAITKEQTLSCKETVLGDIRVWYAARSQQMIVHFDSKKLLVTIKNSARPEHETDVILRIEGYSTGSSRDAHLVRNDQAVNIDMLIIGELRVLTGMTRQTNA